MSSSATPVSRGSLPPSSFLGRFVVASIVAVVAVFFGRCYTIKIEVLQILGLSLVSIIAVGIVAGILIYITPDVINSKTDKKHGTFNRRGRTRHRSRDAIKKVPSLPPRPSHPRTTNSNYFNYNSTTGRVRSSNSRYRRYSSPPSLGRSLSQQSTLNPIAERRLEDLPDYDDYWWRELDSRYGYNCLVPSCVIISFCFYCRCYCFWIIIIISAFPFCNSGFLVSMAILSLTNLTTFITAVIFGVFYYLDWYYFFLLLLLLLMHCSHFIIRTKYYALILGYTQPTWDEDHELYDLICEGMWTLRELMTLLFFSQVLTHTHTCMHILCLRESIG